MKKNTKTAKAVTIHPIYTVTARNTWERLNAKKAASASSVRKAMMDSYRRGRIQTAAARAAAAMAPAVRPAVPAGYRGEVSAVCRVPFAWAVRVVSLSAVVSDVRRRRSAAAVLPLEVCRLSLSAARAVVRRRLQWGGMSRGNTVSKRDTWGQLTDRHGGGDYLARLHKSRADLRDWFGLDLTDGEAGTVRRVVSPYWLRLGQLEQTAAAHAEAAETAHTTARHYGKLSAAAKRAGDVATAAVHSRTKAQYLAEERRERAKAAEARQKFAAALSETAGDGVELFQTAYAYLWERLAVDGLSTESLLHGVGKDGREYVKTVFQWAFTLVNRSTVAQTRADAETAKWAAYVDRGQGMTDNAHVEPESEERRNVVRAPRYWDVTATLDEHTPGENVQTISDLVERLGLTKTQNAILSLRLRGMGYGKIAETLGVSKGTIQTHLKRMQAATAAALNLSPEKVERLTAKYGKK